MSSPTNEAMQKARSILREPGSVAVEDVIRVVKQLKREQRFTYARRVLATVRRRVAESEPEYVFLGQQHALCTYKDGSLPALWRLERAWKLLTEVDDPNLPNAQQETLGIAGAIWKRRWEVTQDKQDLERSLAYYRAGVDKGIEKDDGYTAVNAAFVLDLLAAEDDRLPARVGVLNASTERRDAAQALRAQVVGLLKPKQPAEGVPWWLAVTLAEAYFGLRDYGAAEATLDAALGTEQRPDKWELESTARQLAMLARTQEGRDFSIDRLAAKPAGAILRKLIGSDTHAIRGLFMGKVGLALSGGGFRASLFHIGVLARLAELDLLRHVEVISCVSGGSIVGAHYYLKLKQLLESKADRSIRREDYLQIVKDLERDFLAGVQRNIRTRLFAEFTTNLRMLFQPGFTRTKRAGELYESELYARVGGKLPVKKPEPWHMSDLLIKPAGADKFHPLHDNWQRDAKVPMLVLNATTLNTGHNWQFTATWMGEPPGDIDTDIDSNYRLRRLYYDEAPQRYRKVRLGHAVAASAAVPAIFDPIELPLLYERAPEDDEKGVKPITVCLADGGVHDNQGTSSLIDQGCSVQLVSDASGQMNDIDEPKHSPLTVLTRSSSVQGARIRIAQYDQLAGRRQAGALRLFFVHLKRGLSVRSIDWIECSEPNAIFGDPPTKPDGDTEETTYYGVNKHAQRLIANLRTDLDTFSDAEAYALMLSGYKMTSKDAPNCELNDLIREGDPEPWPFKAIETALASPLAKSETKAQTTRLQQILRSGSQRAFKVWHLEGKLKVLKYVLAAIAFAAGALLVYRNRSVAVGSSVGALGIAALLMIVGRVGGRQVKRLLSYVNYRKRFSQILGSVVLALGGFLIARVHLWVFDPIYRRYGSIRHFTGAESTGRTGAQPVDAKTRDREPAIAVGAR